MSNEIDAQFQQVTETLEEMRHEIEMIWKAHKDLDKSVRDLWDGLHGDVTKPEQKQVVENRNVNADSLTIGAPTNGQIKVYGDFGNPHDFQQKIDAAQELLKHSKQPVGV